MMKETYDFSGIILTGKEAVIVPTLAIIGGAAIITVIGIGVFSISERVFTELEIQREKLSKKKGRA